jgi:hypothetical protein
VKFIFKDPNLCRQFYWDAKNAVREIITGTNTFDPAIGFSSRNKVACSVRGALRYLFLRKDRSARRLWEQERQQPIFTSPAAREIEALEAQGFRLHHREGDEYHFVKEK